MKKAALLILWTALFLPVLVSPSFVLGEASWENKGSRDNGAAFNDLTGKEWLLSEIRSGGNTITIDRNKLGAINMGGAFSLSFRQEASAAQGQAAGLGAPNRYFGPYTAGENKTLSIGTLASTMMLAFAEPDNLKEKEFFDYLANVTRWDLNGGKLELYTVNSSKAAAVMVFVLK